MTTEPTRAAYQSVMPYLMVPDASRLIEFLAAAFGATERMRSTSAEGRIMHGEVQIGDSVVMLGDAAHEANERPASLYLSLDHANDVDATYAHALEVGGTSVREPEDQDYGERSAGVKDPSGNTWWLAAPVAAPAS